MRDTARLQVLALALIGAIAWISIDLGAVRTALAGLVPDAPATAPAEPGGPNLDAPLLGEDIRPRERSPRQLRPLRIGHPHPSVWVITKAIESNVG